MSDYAFIVLVAAIIYFSECICFFRAEEFPISVRGRKWKPLRRWGELRGGRFRVGLAPILPHSGIAVCQQDPIFVTAEAICACKTSANRDIPLDHATFSSEESFLCFQNRRALRLPSPQAATKTRLLLNDLATTRPPDRETRILKHYRSLLDSRAVRRRLRPYLACRLSLASYAALLLAEMFFLLPALFWFSGVKLFAIAMLIPPLFASIWLFGRIYRSTWNHRMPLRNILIMLLAPPAAGRVIDLLLRELCSDFHWLAVTNAMCSPAVAREAAIAYWRQLNFPAPWEESECLVRNEARRLWIGEVRKFLLSNFGKTAVLLPPPPPVDSSVQAYCPRCHAQYLEAQVCSDCNIPLLPFWTSGAAAGGQGRN